MTDPDKLTREEIAAFRAHHRYREDLRRKNLEAIQEEIRISQMPRSEAREKLGLAVVDLSAVHPKPAAPPPWEQTEPGYIEIRGGENIVTFQQTREQFQRETPIFVQAADAHNKNVDLDNTLNRAWKQNPW